MNRGGGWGPPPALRMLLRLQATSVLRSIRRQIHTPKGILVSVFAAVLLGGVLLPAIFRPAADPLGPAPEVLATVVPFFLAGLFVVNLATGAADQAIGFRRVEVDLLFQAPFSRRQLVIYKLTRALRSLLIVAPLLLPSLVQFSHSRIGALLFCVVGLPMIQLSTTVYLLMREVAHREMGVLRTTIGELLGWSTVGALTLESLLATPGASIPALQELLAGPLGWTVLLVPRELGCTLADPEACTLGYGSAAGLAILNVVLLGVAVQLDGVFVKASMSRGARLEARLERLRKGAGAAAFSDRILRVELPSLPRLGGAGPIAQTKLLSAARRTGIHVTLGGMACMAIGGQLLLGAYTGEADLAWGPLAILAFVAGWATLFLPSVLRLDFRGDLERAPLLRALPLNDRAVVLGQILPVVCLVVGLDLLIAADGLIVEPQAWREILTALAFTTVAVVLVVAIENTLFLMFPLRDATQGSTLDRGIRQFFLQLATWTTLGLVFAVVGAGGVSVWWLTGDPVLAVAGAWLLLVLTATTAVATTGLAWRSFDPGPHVAF